MLTASALFLAPAAGATAVAANAGSGSGGSASATVLSTKLDVSLLNSAVNIPLNLTLNHVQAPASAKERLLSVRIKGVNNGKPFNILKADVATAKATVDAQGSEGYSNLVNAQVNLPGLPMPLVGVKLATSKAECLVGKAPTAHSNVLGPVTVLGQTVHLKAKGNVVVNSVLGTVTLSLSQIHTTSHSAEGTALALNIHLNPANLNIAKVDGSVILSDAQCSLRGGSTGGSTSGSTAGSTSGSTSGSTAGSTSGSTAGSTSGATAGSTSGATAGSTSGATAGSTSGSTASGGGLAETGASSNMPYLLGGAVVLLAGGGAAVFVSRRRKA